MAQRRMIEETTTSAVISDEPPMDFWLFCLTVALAKVGAEIIDSDHLPENTLLIKQGSKVYMLDTEKQKMWLAFDKDEYLSGMIERSVDKVVDNQIQIKYITERR